MKNYLFGLLFFLAIIISSCGNDNTSDKKTVKEDSVKTEVNEAEVLYDFLEKSGDYINSKGIPALVKANEVYANLKNYHIIDVRKNKDYVAGHINGAVNVKFSELIKYMKSGISASAYEKIVLVCYSNHKASYAASILRMLGYGNVYSMKWGMSAWDKNLAENKWLKGTSNKYASKLVTEEFPKGDKDKYPQIKTGKYTGYDILEARAEELLNNMNFKIKADKLFENLDNYYIANYWKSEHYKLGHIPGAIQYTPKKSLLKNTVLSTLPIDKPIVLYCYTGQHASFAVAYLRILGYDAYALAYGANSFMYNELKALGIGKQFNGEKEIKNYPLVEGNEPSIKSEETPDSDSNVEEKPETNAPVIKKKKVEEEEGGC